MTETGKRDWRSIGCAALIGAAIAFPAGIMVGSIRSSGDNAAEVRRLNASGGRPASYRNVYSPQPSKDPYVIDRWRRVADALEASCRQSHLHCVEAAQARVFVQETEMRQ